MTEHTEMPAELTDEAGALLGFEPDDLSDLRSEFYALDTLVCADHAHLGDYTDDKNIVANAIDRLTYALLCVAKKREEKSAPTHKENSYD